MLRQLGQAAVFVAVIHRLQRQIPLRTIQVVGRHPLTPARQVVHVRQGLR